MKTLAEQSLKPASEGPQEAAPAQQHENANARATKQTGANHTTAGQHNKPIRLVDISNQQQQQQNGGSTARSNGYAGAGADEKRVAAQSKTKNSVQADLQNSCQERTSRHASGAQPAQPAQKFLSGPESAETRPGALAHEKAGSQAAPTRSAPPLATSAAAKGAEASAAPASPRANKGEPEGRQEIGLVAKVGADCALRLIRTLVALFDLITWPIHYVRQGVARRKREVDHLRSVKLDPEDPNSPWRQVDIEPFQVDIERKIDSFEGYDDLMRAAFEAHADAPCYGYRQVLEETWLKRPDNPDKLIRQVRLSDYKWCTYAQFDAQIEAARRGLLAEGVRAGQRVILFADTRPEWQICSQALIRLGAIVGTMYSTLGLDGIVHTVNETQAELIIAQGDKVGRLLKLGAKLPKLRRVIYLESSLFLPRKLGGVDESDEREFYAAAKRQAFGAGSPAVATMNANETKTETQTQSIECMNFCELMRRGLEVATGERLEALERENSVARQLRRPSEPARAKKDSLAVIMYTSGSTGVPKGVLISHGNIMATVKSFSYVTKDYIHDAKSNTCTAYLPLAHIFEFCIESVMLYHGVKFGFASPHTLTDKSPGLMAGQSGDLIKLQPTVLIIVPLILDRIVQGVRAALSQQSYFKAQLVSFLIEYKMYWQRHHYETPLVDKIVCSKMAVALGGRARYVICGSAPLAPQTQTFVRAALNLKLPQGFGTTETCAATCCQLFDDQSTANVGLPVSGALIKLEPWLEGNYRPTDRPNPRGEIVVGGQMIAHGYYNLEEATREAFYVDEAGTRWYRTGDIGEMLPNGQLKIIDRKKDLVKLQNGEYISLGRVESTLKSNPYTDNFCVYANSNYNYIVALGPANELAIRTLAQEIVDTCECKLSPSMVRRMGGSQLKAALQANSADSNGTGDGTAGPTLGGLLLLSGGAADERESLLKGELALALDELKEVLASYESDLLNNNNIAPSVAAKTTTTTTTAAAADANAADSTSRSEAREASDGRNAPPPQKARADSGVPPPVGSCLNERLNRLCENKLIVECVLGILCRLARDRNLLSLEIPKKLMLLAEEWTEDKNLVTAAMKIRRNYIYKRYEHELEQLYAP